MLFATGISLDGNIIVGYAATGCDTNGNCLTVAAEWANNQVTTLGFLPVQQNNQPFSEASAVSSDGTVVAGIARNTNGYNAVFRWTAQGGMTDLTPPGQSGSTVSSLSGIMSADGQIVVGQMNLGAMIWTPSTGMMMLMDNLASLGVVGNLGFLGAGQAQAVSPDGRWVVGVFTGGNGSYGDFVADLFTPSPTNSTHAALAAAAGTSGLVWSTTSNSTNVPWVYQSYITHDGIAALESGHSSTNQYGQSILQTVVTGPGVLTYWWRVSSQTGSSNFTFAISGSPKKSISGGDSGWMQESFVIPAGAQTLTWTYNNGSGGGLDSGWIDEVSFDNSTAPKILNTAFEGANLRLYWQGQGGSNYVVQAATNLSLLNPFYDISPVITLSGLGVVATNYLDAGTLTNSPARFYRICGN